MTSLITELELTARFRRQMHSGREGEPFRYCSAEELVLAHGRRFSGAIARTPEPRHCFARAYSHVVHARLPWIYYEGFAIRPPLPLVVYHAWVTHAAQPNLAVDLAWDHPEDCMYIGVPFKTEYVRECRRAAKRSPEYGVINAHWLNFPLLTGKTRVEDVIIL